MGQIGIGINNFKNTSYADFVFAPQGLGQAQGLNSQKSAGHIVVERLRADRFIPGEAATGQSPTATGIKRPTLTKKVFLDVGDKTAFGPQVRPTSAMTVPCLVAFLCRLGIIVSSVVCLTWPRSSSYLTVVGEQRRTRAIWRSDWPCSCMI